MDITQSARSQEMAERIKDFMAAHIYPNERRFYQEAEGARTMVRPSGGRGTEAPGAREAGLWNLFLPGRRARRRADQSRIRTACARSWAARTWRPRSSTAPHPTPATWRCSPATAPTAQKEQWLKPLLAGEIRSCLRHDRAGGRLVAMPPTSKARSCRDGDEYVINGRKWYTTGATDPRCQIIIFMGKTDPDNPDRHKQQSMILVPKDTPGVTVVRALPVFGYYGVPDRASEVVFATCGCRPSNMLLGEGRGFEIAQGRLGPGRIHHCMRLIGLGERTLEKMCLRAEQRVGLRQAGRRADGDARADRRSAHHDRPVAPADPQCCAHDGHRRQQGGTGGDRHDQGGGAEHGLPGTSTGRSRPSAAAVPATISASPPPMQRPASCAWPTVPTRFTATRSRKLELRRYRNSDPAHTGGDGAPLQPGKSEAWSAGGLWPRPMDLP